jgi:thiamine-phosphate pyrophosphorylase
MLTVGPAPTPVRGKATMFWRCHGLAELEAVGDAEFVSLSPIFPTASKPGYGPPLGLSVLGQASRPVYALGGIDAPCRAVACIESGAYGVVVMGAITRAENPCRVAERFLGALR